MGLFLDAAKAWNELCEISFFIKLGHKGKRFAINLSFAPCDLPHLVGMQYAKDVDFGLRRAEYYGSNLLDALLCGKLDESKMYNARAWPCIEGRLKAIISLKKTLSGSFTIARFNPKKVCGSCSIDAEFVIKNTISGETFFVFLDEENERYYCKSAFQSRNTDYMRFQTQLTVLEVAKKDSAGIDILYRHPNYKETPPIKLSTAP